MLSNSFAALIFAMVVLFGITIVTLYQKRFGAAARRHRGVAPIWRSASAGAIIGILSRVVGVFFALNAPKVKILG